MKKTVPVILFILAVLFLSAWNKTSPGEKPFARVKKQVLRELEATEEVLRQSITSLKEIKTLQALYHQSRRHYKHIEFFTEYCSFRESKLYINGPLVPKYDEDFGRKMLPPHGFQRIEELLFDAPVPVDTMLLRQEYQFLLHSLSNVKKQYQSLVVQDGLIMEMCQLEIARVASLMLNGYDASFTQTNVLECAWILEGMEETIRAFYPETAKNEKAKRYYQKLNSQLKSCKKFLLVHRDYNNFPRIDFIVDYLNPLNRQLVDLHQALRLPWNKNDQAILVQEPFLFGRESFNPKYFSVYHKDSLYFEQQAALGKKLFYDPLLSGNQQRSCSSCHDPQKAFTDGLSRSTTIKGSESSLRNAPGLFNVSFQRLFFYDGRAFRLEQQVFQVIHNQDEMGGNLEEIVKRLKHLPEYKKLFAAAFKGTIDSVITPFAVQKAITEYEKTLVSFNTRFDQYLRGNKSSLNKREINGYNLFAGKALCGTCHFFPLFNGTVPPFYSDSEFEVIGVPENPDNKNIDPDPGRYKVTGANGHQHAFKTPTVRNIILTAPYMHNGIYNTLEEVIEFYHKGGGKGLGINVPNQTLPFDSLLLTPTEKEDIILFMKALTDTSIVRRKY